MNCPKCGKDAGESKFCPECGAEIGVTGNAMLSENKTAKKAKKKGKGFIVILVIIAILAAVVYVPKLILKSNTENGEIVEEVAEPEYIEILSADITLNRKNQDISVFDWDITVKNIGDLSIEQLSLIVSLYNKDGVEKTTTTLEFETVIAAGEEKTLTPDEWKWGELYKAGSRMNFEDVFVDGTPVAEFESFKISSAQIKFSDETTEETEINYVPDNLYYTGVFGDNYYYVDYPDESTIKQEFMLEDEFIKDKDLVDEQTGNYPYLPN